MKWKPVIILGLVMALSSVLVSSDWVRPDDQFSLGSNESPWTNSSVSIVPKPNFPQDVRIPSGNLTLRDLLPLTNNSGRLGLEGQRWGQAYIQKLNVSELGGFSPINVSAPLVSTSTVSATFLVGDGSNITGLTFNQSSGTSTFPNVTINGFLDAQNITAHNVSLFTLSVDDDVTIINGQLNVLSGNTNLQDVVMDDLLADIIQATQLSVVNDINTSGNVIIEGLHDLIFTQSTMPREVGILWPEHFLKQGANSTFGLPQDVDNAFHFHHEMAHPEGTVLMMTSSALGVHSAQQTGNNNSASFTDRSVWFGNNRGSFNTTQLTDCFFQADLENYTLRTDCDTLGDGADGTFTGSVTAMRDLFYGRSFRGEGKFQVFNGGGPALFSNFSINSFIIQASEVSSTGRTTFFNADFDAGTIQPFVRLISQGPSTRNWLSTSTLPAFCGIVPCARALGGNSGALRIMETNISTLNLSEISLNFSLGIVGFDAGIDDNLSVFIKNSSTQEFDLIFNYTDIAGTVDSFSIERVLPDTINNQSNITLRFEMHATQDSEAAFVDDVIMTGNVSGVITVVDEFTHSEFLLGNPTEPTDQRIFWNDTIDTLFLPNQTRVLGTLTVNELIDLTPAYEGDMSSALSQLVGISSMSDGRGGLVIDHSSLPEFAHTQTNGVEGRSIGAMISIITDAMKEVNRLLTDHDSRVADLETENALLKDQLCLKDITYSWC